MGRVYEGLDESLTNWIMAQRLMFVATAPNDPNGHVNVSPKGLMDTFRILDESTVAYLDLLGSGIETVAHLRENGRIVIMFCAFEGAPKVLRLHGRGRTVQPHNLEFTSLLKAFDLDSDLERTLRSIIVVNVTRISDSCGFVVPRMEYVEERDTLFRWAEHQHQREGDGWAAKYQQANNLHSIDGLPGMDLSDDLAEDDLKKFSSSGRAL